MAERYQHLQLVRSELQRERRRRGGFGGQAPADPVAHARRLEAELDEHLEPMKEEIAGFDPRRLLRLTVDGLAPDELEAIPGLSVVSEQGKNITVFFATEAALLDFRTRLGLIAAGRKAVRKDILFAVQHFDFVQPADRMGSALKNEGAPKEERFAVDVELWPLDLRPDRRTMIAGFRGWCESAAVTIIDSVDNDAVVMLRLDVNQSVLNRLLRMRDVRMVELPPRFQFHSELLQASIQDVPEIVPPPAGAPGVVVLDSGIVSNHPLLAPAVGDAQSFDPTSTDGADKSGHGTAVAGLALYGEIEGPLNAKTLNPKIWLFSGRISDASGSVPTQFVENRVARAVEYFKREYDCKIFNLSFGDERKPYTGGHVDRFAATLDVLAREHDVLFVVSSGNFRGDDGLPANWKSEYPDYLLSDHAKIIDPAPALNVLTVGSIAQYDQPRTGVRFPDDPAYQPIARVDEPSPFTRSGFGPCKSIKPELVDHGGNRWVDMRTNCKQLDSGSQLGVLTTSNEFASGRLLAQDCGTSYASAKVANLAAQLLGAYSDASPNLLRALLVAHAQLPKALLSRFAEDKEAVLRLAGYGRASLEASSYSTDSRVTMFAEDEIGADEHHFYEVPLPEDFYSPPARRVRTISVGLAHFPRVRRTRIDYKESALSFRVVRARDVNVVAQAYRRLKKGEKEPSIKEAGFSPSPNYRSGGTVQAAIRTHRQMNKGFEDMPYFVVVTNSVPNWVSNPQNEKYSLVVGLEDRSEQVVQLYAQVRQLLRARARVRAQVQG